MSALDHFSTNLVDPYFNFFEAKSKQNLLLIFSEKNSRASTLFTERVNIA